MINILKQSAAYTLALVAIAGSLFPILEPQVLRAQSASDTVMVTLTVDSGITITSPVDVNLGPSNIGVAVNSAIGSTTWNVKTNDPDGYTLSVKASTTPALKNGVVASFADYTPAVGGTPDTWTTPSGSIEFGYSAYGSHVNTSTWGTGSSCGSGQTPSATQKWNGFSTSNFTVATASGTTTTAGINTTVCFAAEQDTFYAPAGTYTAHITATATVI